MGKRKFRKGEYKLKGLKVSIANQYTDKVEIIVHSKLL